MFYFKETVARFYVSSPSLPAMLPLISGKKKKLLAIKCLYIQNEWITFTKDKTNKKQKQKIKQKKQNKENRNN